MKKTQPVLNAAYMLDVVISNQNLKNDAALARALKVAAPVISKVRNNVLPVGATLLVKLHEATGMTTKEIKTLAGIE
jgi:plasmid maintenance system antidote protein VapI